MKICGDKYIEFQKITIPVLLGLTSLFLGAFIYITLRPNEPIFFSWLNKIGLKDLLTDIQNLSMFKTLVLPKWIIYSLPNGFWAFSYSVLIISIWWNSRSFVKYFWLASIPALILGYEILQINQFLAGTFSMHDISAGITGILLGTLLGIKLNKKYSHEKS